MNVKTFIPGHLEIDHQRGVVYFHAAGKDVLLGIRPTPLRIQGLAKPIPDLTTGYQIDVRVEEHDGYSDTHKSNP